MSVEIYKMKAKYFVALIFLMIIVGNNYAIAHISEPLPGTIKPTFYEPHEIVDIYFKAVNRGELVVFEQKIDKSMLTSIRVEYVYELNSSTLRVKVYS